MWDYTVVIQGQDYEDGQWGDEHYHVEDVGCGSLGEAISFVESVTPEQALEWERRSGCNGLDICVFADEVEEDGTYSLEFEVVTESNWVGDRMVGLSLLPWSPVKAEHSRTNEPPGAEVGDRTEPWVPSGEKWDEATFCWEVPDGVMVISAFPTANDGGGYSVSVCVAGHGEMALSDSGQYFAYESVSDVVADYVGSGERLVKLLDAGFEFESYDDLCEWSSESAGVDIDEVVGRMRRQRVEASSKARTISR